MRCLRNVRHDRCAELSEALSVCRENAILLREAQVHLLPSTARVAAHTQQPTEQSIANGAFALGMMTGIAFVAAALMLAKLLSF